MLRKLSLSFSLALVALIVILVLVAPADVLTVRAASINEGRGALPTAPTDVASKIIINELLRSGTFGATGDEWVELLLVSDLTTDQLQGFYFGDSTATPNSKYSAYQFTNTDSIAPMFYKGTIIVIGGGGTLTDDVSYNPAGGDWNIVLAATGSYLKGNANTGDFAGTDVAWVDTSGTGSTISADGFAVKWGATAGTLGSAANLTVTAPANGSGLVFTSTLSGITIPGNWATSVISTSLTRGNPNGGDNTIYINSLRAAYVPLPDLGIAKSGPSIATPGQTITYTIQLSNTGPGTGTGTLITDTLPTAVVYVTYTATPVVTLTSSSGNELVWDLGDIATGGAETVIEVQGQVANNVANGKVVTNTVTASTATTETNTSNNTRQVTTTINAPALGVVKSVEPSTNVAYHGEVTYTVVLNNSGSVNATGARLTDTLPVEVNFARWVDRPSGANQAADEITWTGAVDVGQPVTFTFVATHIGAYDDVVTNTASFEALNGSGSADATFTVVSATPNLSINKTVTPDTAVRHNSEVTYTVTLNNSGAMNASNVTLTDTLPLSTTFARWVAQPIGAAETAGVINWTGTVSAANSLDFVFVVTQTADYAATITNTAEFVHTTRSGSADAAFTVEPLYPVTFVYHDAEDVALSGDNVALAGSYNSWTGMVVLTPDAGNTTFTATLNLPAGNYEYKYIVQSGGDQWDWLNTTNRSLTVSGAATINSYRNVSVGWANLQWPPTISIDLGSATPDIYGRVNIPGVTNSPNPARGLQSQVGYGTNASPVNWAWSAMVFQGQDGPNNQEYRGVFTPTAGGVFSYATRFNGNWGVGNPNSAWAYGDLNGSPFSVDQAGVLTVTLPNIPVIINELDSDQVGTDTAEFIELYDGGVGNTSLNGLALVLFNGNGNVVYSPTFDLDGYMTNANGYFVVGGVNVSPTADIVVNASSWLQNGPDGAALYVGNATDFPVGTTVTNTNLSNLVDAIVYNTDGVTAPGLQVLLNPGQPQVNEGGRGSSTINSLQRCPNGSGGARNTNTYYQNTPTPKGSNLCPASYDAAIVKTGPSSIQPGANVTYTIVYSNVGLSALSGVVITDILPAGLTYITDTSGLLLINANPLVWQVGSLTRTLKSFQVVAAVSASASGYLTNTAEIAMAETDAAPDNNISTHSAPAASFDLEVIKSADQPELFLETGISRLLTYTIRINNRSVVSATMRVTATDVLPAGFVYASDDSGVMPTGTGASGDPLVWGFTNPIAPSGSLVFHVVVTVGQSVSASALYSNQISIASEPADPIAANNTAQADVFVWKQISLAEARTLPLSSTVYVGGYVNFPPGLVSTAAQANDEFLMQDASLGTAGISVFYNRSTAKFNKFAVGDYVLAHGALAEYNGKLELIVVSNTHAVSTGLNIPLTPWVRTTGQISENTEGILVQTEGTITTIPANGLHLYVDDGSGLADIFRDQDTPNVSFAGYQVGDKVRVTGVGTQYDFTAPYDGYYEVIVRYQSDVVGYPTVTSVLPADSATDVAVTANVSATFNTTMTNVSNATFTLHDASGAVAGAVTYDAATRTALFNPTADLANGTRYTATLSADLAASNGTTLTQNYVWSFTTVAALPDLSTSTKVNSVNAAVFAGDWVTYTIQLNNTGNLNATARVTDVLPSYYTAAQLLDFSQPTTGTLTWTGVVTAGQSVTLQFVAQVAPQSLPLGTTILFNTAEVNDGHNAAFAIDDPMPPFITLYGLRLPLVMR